MIKPKVRFIFRKYTKRRRVTIIPRRCKTMQSCMRVKRWRLARRSFPSIPHAIIAHSALSLLSSGYYFRTATGLAPSSRKTSNIDSAMHPSRCTSWDSTNTPRRAVFHAFPSLAARSSTTWSRTFPSPPTRQRFRITWSSDSPHSRVRFRLPRIYLERENRNTGRRKRRHGGRQR